MAAIGALAPMPPRMREIESRFAPRATEVQRSAASGSSSSISASSFGSVLSGLLSSASADTDSSSIDLSSLTSLLQSTLASSNITAGRTGAVTDVTTPTGPNGTDVVNAAKKYLGVDYVWGGTDPTKGLDCSGLVQRAYRDVGVELPRVSYDQAKVGQPVASIAEAKPGDLVAFGSPVDHIAIYVGDGKIIQAPHTGDVVKISDIKRPITAIRRVLPDTPTTATGTLAATATTSSATGIPGAAPYEQLFQQAGARYGLNPRLLAAVAKTESNFNPSAVSGVGAVGLMQFMPATAKGMGIDPTDPAQAINGAAKYLRTQLDRFGSIDLALAAYNAGPGAVQRAGGIPPYAETRSYVTKILGLLNGQSPTDGLNTTNGVLT
ncbi:MAG: transglycosylase SLT domain-containing protein [Acidimicrobiales bacterium]